MYAASENDGALDYTIQAIGELRRDVVIAVNANDGTATLNSDYSSISEILVFNQTSTQHTRTVIIKTDFYLEVTETVFIKVTSNDVNIDISEAQAQLNISDSNGRVSNNFYTNFFNNH